VKPATTYSQVLGHVVAQHRKKRGMTQAQIAKQLGITQAGYSGLERGRSPFTVPQLRKVCGVLQVPVEQVLRLTDAAVANLVSKGVRVLNEKPPAGSGWLWVAGGVIAAVVAGVVAVAITKSPSDS